MLLSVVLLLDDSALLKLTKTSVYTGQNRTTGKRNTTGEINTYKSRQNEEANMCKDKHVELLINRDDILN